MAHPRPPTLPAVTTALAAFQSDLVDEVAAAIAQHPVVVVGVSGLRPGTRARTLLDEQKIPFHYLEYGSYFSGWRRRLALKIWVGWPTFPMVFIKGTFIGGASDLHRLIESGELKSLLG
jgi:monothiol glutaredoxin